MAKKITASTSAFAKVRDKLIVQPLVTAVEFKALAKKLKPGMKVKNFTSDNIGTIGTVGSLYVTVTVTIMSGKRAGKKRKATWFILNIDPV